MKSAIERSGNNRDAVARRLTSRRRAAAVVLASGALATLTACSGEGGGTGAAGSHAGGAANAAAGVNDANGEASDAATVLGKASSRMVIDRNTGQVTVRTDEVLFDAPIDRGESAARQGPSQGDPSYKAQGTWSAAQTWPEIPIHAALTPDGRVMTFGTDASGQQGAQFNYSVWDPVSGDHLILKNTTPTDIFCSAQVLLPGSGDLLLAGGDIRGRQIPNPNGGGILVNLGVDDVNRFHYQSNTLERDTPMRLPRWYASVLSLPDGRVFTVGGVDDKGAGAANPEVYDPTTKTWSLLNGITYYESYPRVFLAPSGKIVGLFYKDVTQIDVSGTGSMTYEATLPTDRHWKLPAVEYEVGKLLAVREAGAVSLVDINGATPVITEAPGVGPRREWSSLTTMADGQVLLTGGGVDNLGGDNVSLGSSIWNPATGSWTEVAPAAKSREYHSVALLLPDGRVLSAGGGAPGPVIQLNGEVYTPPYLYDAAGNLAARPTIASAPATLKPGATPYRLKMGSADPVSRVTMVRTGSVTHSANFDQSFLSVSHTQAGDQVLVDVDRASTVLRPGYYMVFAFNAQGVPSTAHTVRVDPREEATQPEPSVAATITTFADRDDITLAGSATTYAPNGFLQLVADAGDQVGGVWYRTPVVLNGQTSFSQQVQFRTQRTGLSDGMAVVLQGASPSPLGAAGEGLGYGGLPNSVAIEIDTYQNSYDPDANHISVLADGNMSAQASYSPRTALASQNWRTVWVDYDATTKLLSVRLRFLASDIRPANPVLTQSIDLAAALGSERLFLGLTSASGGISNPYRVRKWQFTAGPNVRSSDPVTDIVDEARDAREAETQPTD